LHDAAIVLEQLEGVDRAATRSVVRHHSTRIPS
jgi:hypothetical protein